MATVIKAGNVASGAQVTPDATGILQFNTGSGAGTAAMTLGTDQSVAFAGNLTVDGNTTLGNANTDTILMTAAPSIGGAGLGMGFGFRNRIINGAMVIDQRNAGASLNPADFAYSLDRWKCRRSQASKFTVQQNAGSVTPPAGFSNYLGVTSSSAYSVLAADYFVIQQLIEGFNFADFAYGTANAATLTLSFWVRSSLTGTFGGALQNNAENRSYGFTYTISAANTWEQKTITIVGDTSGTWIGATNGNGLYVNFNLGTGSTYGAATNGAWASGTTAFAPSGTVSVVGTNAATWYITGVQLEKGSTATSFDFRDYGTELVRCQRYYEKSYDQGTTPGTVSSLGMFTSIRANGIAGTSMTFKVTKRAAPLMTAYSPGTGTAGNGRDYNVGAERAVTFDSIGDSAFTISMGGASVSSAFGTQWVASIEL